ncbi:hypothetical protein [Mycobacteroides chelonae]|uniref:hypothetical protein n=1 Tax=Mycobacteroides chelonae TaxID=1774 RepID=UPI001E340B7B|nr:hypothetical protein [Mycobacteroides chelonae]
MEKHRGVEDKSGQVPDKDFDRQLKADSEMVKKHGWDVDYYLREPLKPSQMQRLAELQAESNGKFNYEVVIPHE